MSQAVSYDDEAVLLTKIACQYDGGIPSPQYDRTEVFASRRSATRSESYAAMRDGYTVAIVLLTDRTEYEAAVREGEEPSMVEYAGKTFRILRTYGEGTDQIELILEER